MVMVRVPVAMGWQWEAVLVWGSWVERRRAGSQGL